mmetsp:Transcript_13991/g.55171  ORF Transcript_13991/g.55171 Transcript_13991/m.55171 type:complete len:424 (+) Transcript_13991:254-1525(+)
MTAPSTPAFLAMVRVGTLQAFFTILMPCSWSKFSPFTEMLRAAQRSAEPPPGTMPSSRAALVAFSASTRRSFFSETSTSLAPPTRTTATPPVSLPRRSWSFSLSYSDVAFSRSVRICSMRCSSALVSLPFSITVVESDVTSMLLAVPSCASSTSSSLSPRSSLTTFVLRRAARSAILSFLWLPKPGAFTAITLKLLRILFSTSVARASPSTFSAMITSVRLAWPTFSIKGRRAWPLEIFFSQMSTRGSSARAVFFLGSVMKAGEMKPWSKLMPWVTSSSSVRVLPSPMETVPSLPTSRKARASSLPASASLLAEIVATCSISSSLLTSLVMFFNCPTMSLTARLMPRRRSMGFMPAATALQPSVKMARVSTVAVVVPSPAASLALFATLRTSCAPTFSCASASSTCLATVTPSLVICGAPKDF